MNMKKNILIYICLFFLATKVKAESNSGIHFRNISYQEALNIAKKENKMVFLHGYAEWCTHCKAMAETVYPDSALGVFYTTNFICIKMDMEKEGKALASRFQVSKYPALLYLDGEGNIVHRTTGELKVPGMLQLGKDALDPTKQYRTFESKFKEGLLSTDEARKYFILKERAGISAQQDLNTFFANMPVEDMTKPDNWRLIWDVLLDPRIPLMKTVIANKKTFEKAVTADSINMKILSVYNGAMMKAAQQLDNAEYDRLKAEVRGSGLDIADKIVEYVDLNVLRLKGDYQLYAKNAPPFVEKYCMDDSRKLSEIAKEVSDRTYDTLLLAKAESWAIRSVELLDIYKHNFNLASIQFKLGKKKEAKKVAEHAIDIGNKTGVDTKPSLLLLEKIEELP